ncbi:MAG: transglycosylase domain-containing protein [Rubrivivax sp.]
MAQQWVPLAQISPNLQRAVIASEDAAFTEHLGVDWEAVERAWERNQREEARSNGARATATAARRGSASNAPRRPPKLVGGSRPSRKKPRRTPLLSGERTALRKAQELVLTLSLEALLFQAAHPGDLSQQRRMGEGLGVRCGALLLAH